METATPVGDPILSSVSITQDEPTSDEENTNATIEPLRLSPASDDLRCDKDTTEDLGSRIKVKETYNCLTPESRKLLLLKLLDLFEQDVNKQILESKGEINRPETVIKVRGKQMNDGASSDDLSQASADSPNDDFSTGTDSFSELNRNRFSVKKSLMKIVKVFRRKKSSGDGAETSTVPPA